MEKGPNIVAHRAILFLMVLLLGLPSGIATVSFSGDFYNSEYSTSISESAENVNAAGYAILMPSEGSEQYPYSILAGSGACANQVNASAEFSSSISASGLGKSFSTQAMLQEDAGVAPVLSSKWRYSLALGDRASMNGPEICALDQVINIDSIPGYGTYLTSINLHPTATTGIVSRGFDQTGHLLIGPEYVPIESYPATFGVYYTSGTHFENELTMHFKWPD
jgi:hypothetical protein